MIKGYLSLDCKDSSSHTNQINVLYWWKDLKKTQLPQQMQESTWPNSIPFHDKKNSTN